MTNETKEILHKLNYKAEHYILYNYEVKLLLDYITNLQQENEKLKYQLEIQKDLTIKNRMRKHIYKSRCEKAIEYIQNENNIQITNKIRVL